MRALYFDGNSVRTCDRPEPRLGVGEALVRVHLAGVCNTDLEIAKGYMGFAGILGHEFVGTVEDGPTEWRGSRVVGEINFACGECDACRSGLARHCPTRRVMGILNADGAFAEYLAVPTANLHRVPDGVSDEAAVFTEPLAAAFEIREQLPLDSTMRCLVMGDGKLGLLAAQVLDQAGAQVVALGRHAHKLEVLGRRGIQTADADTWQLGGAPLFDLVVEATGSAAGLERAIAATRPRGTVVLKSTVASQHAIDLAPVVINEIQVLGSRCGPFAPALQALDSQSVDVQNLVSERFSLEGSEAALRAAASRKALKILIDCAS